MTLVRNIENAAATVEQAGTPDAARFSEREQRALLAEVREAHRWELESALWLTSEDGMMPVTETNDRDRSRAYIPRSMWNLDADQSFRVQLHAAVRTGIPTAPSTGDNLPPVTSTSRLAPIRAAVPRQRPGPRRFAVLLIDATYTNVYWSDDLPREHAAMRAVLDRANQNGMPVFEVVWPDEGFATDEQFAAKRRPDNWVTVEKTSRSAFYRTNLADELRARGITDLVVMGLYQEQCVAATVASAAGRGFRIHSSPDLVQVMHPREFPPGMRFDTSLHGWAGAPDANIVEDARELPIF